MVEVILFLIAQVVFNITVIGAIILIYFWQKKQAEWNKFQTDWNEKQNRLNEHQDKWNTLQNKLNESKKKK